MTHNEPLLSIIIPVCNEQENILWHYKNVVAELKKLPVRGEIIYVDDGSTDSSLNGIKKLAQDNDNVGYIAFSKNFGKEAAISAGLKKAKGAAALTIDADGQHPVELIGEFVKKWQGGAEVVFGIRQSNKGEGFIKAAGSKMFYTLLHLIDSRHSINRNATDFTLVDRKVIDQYNLLTERNRISRNLIQWLGFKQDSIAFDAHARHAGKATYSYRKLVKLAIDGAIKHSTRPLKFIGALGVLTSFVSAFLLILLLINYLLGDILHLGVSGTAVLAIFLSFLIGIVLCCQGLLALYIENVYYETQNRPLYIVREEA